MRVITGLGIGNYNNVNYYNNSDKQPDYSSVNGTKMSLYNPHLRMYIGITKWRLSMPTVSIIIPVYNYASRVHKTIRAIASHVEKNNSNWEIFFVDDGSKDQTVAAVRTLIEPFEYMKLLIQPSNLGKGAAVRRGFQEASGEYQLFTDVDLAYGLDELQKVVDTLEKGADMAFADRRHPMSKCSCDDKKVDYQQKRDVMSKVLNHLVQRMGLGNIRDTQAGLKGLRKEYAQLIRRGQINGFPFDIELFAMARVNNLHIESVPVRYHIADAPSTVMPIPVAIDFIKSIQLIRKNMIRGTYYAVSKAS